MHKLDLNPTQPSVQPNVRPGYNSNSSFNTPVSTTYAPNMNQTVKAGLPVVMVILVLGIALLAGSATGFGSFKLFGQKGGNSNATMAQVASGTLKAGDVFGSQDINAFKDNAQGYLIVGGIEGEGSHHLIRTTEDPVYLTSSITDLDKFSGMEVRVWGETYKAQKAGWLMDVGRVEVVNPQAPAPAGLETTAPPQVSD